jgi:hypothetical protein
VPEVVRSDRADHHDVTRVAERAGGGDRLVASLAALMLREDAIGHGLSGSRQVFELND